MDLSLIRLEIKYIKLGKYRHTLFLNIRLLIMELVAVVVLGYSYVTCGLALLRYWKMCWWPYSVIVVCFAQSHLTRRKFSCNASQGHQKSTISQCVTLYRVEMLMTYIAVYIVRVGPHRTMTEYQTDTVHSSALYTVRMPLHFLDRIVSWCTPCLFDNSGKSLQFRR